MKAKTVAEYLEDGDSDENGPDLPWFLMRERPRLDRCRRALIALIQRRGPPPPLPPDAPDPWESPDW